MSAVKVENISKVYKLYDSPTSRLKEALHPFRKKYHHDFYALKDVNFEVEEGETLGIIGKNGSGKSTLLKIITGVLAPTSGNVTVNGEISALLELGGGFNPEFTGIENVYFRSSMMGYSKQEIDEKLDNIIAFADIGDFIHQPVKTYSSGMYVRLAFSVATNIDPDILLVDESLSVGDLFFQAKSIERMKRMIDNGATLVFVSHDMGSIKSLCQKSILLNDGQILAYDTSDKVVEKYFSFKVESQQNVKKCIPGIKEQLPEKKEIEKHLAFVPNEAFQKRASYQRIQNGKARFINVQLLNEDEKEIEIVEYEQNVILRMAMEIHEDIKALGVAYHIKDKNGVNLVYTDTIIENKMLTSVKQGERYIIDFRFRASLIHGNYNILCAISIPINLEIGEVDYCDYVPYALQFQVQKRKETPMYGCVHLENTVEIVKMQNYYQEQKP